MKKLCGGWVGYLLEHCFSLFTYWIGVTVYKIVSSWAMRLRFHFCSRDYIHQNLFVLREYTSWCSELTNTPRLAVSDELGSTAKKRRKDNVSWQYSCSWCVEWVWSLNLLGWLLVSGELSLSFLYSSWCTTELTRHWLLLFSGHDWFGLE